MQYRDSLFSAQVLFAAFGGMTFSVSDFTLKGIGLAGIAGVVLNLILPKRNWVEEKS